MDKDKKGPPKAAPKALIEGVEILILIVFIVGIALVWNFSTYFDRFKVFLMSDSSGFIGGLKAVIGVINGFAIILCIMLLLGIFIAAIGLKDIRHREKKRLDAHVEEAENTAAKGDPMLTMRWRKILELTDSTNQNDWRQAIIDADSILDEIVEKMGFPGETLGDRLRNADKGDFKTIEQAGEAHGVRNRIAHDGSAFLLNQQETRRVVGLYKQVFTEFFYI